MREWHTLGGRDHRIVVAIAEHGSRVKAGRVLRMSQPRLTRNLAQIEEKLGAALFDRSWRGMAPTDTGRAILAQGHEIVVRLDALTTTMEALRGTQMRTLTIASAVMPLDSLALPAVAAGLDGARGTRVQVLATDVAEAIRLVEDRRADLAVVEIAELPALGQLEVVPPRRHAVQHWVRPGHPCWPWVGPPGWRNSSGIRCPWEPASRRDMSPGLTNCRRRRRVSMP